MCLFAKRLSGGSARLAFCSPGPQPNGPGHCLTVAAQASKKLNFSARSLLPAVCHAPLADDGVGAAKYDRGVRAEMCSALCSEAAAGTRATDADDAREVAAVASFTRLAALPLASDDAAGNESVRSRNVVADPAAPS